MKKIGKKCNKCLETIHKDAKRCKFCGYDFEISTNINIIIMFINSLIGFLAIIYIGWNEIAFIILCICIMVNLNCIEKILDREYIYE